MLKGGGEGRSAAEPRDGRAARGNRRRGAISLGGHALRASPVRRGECRRVIYGKELVEQNKEYRAFAECPGYAGGYPLGN